MNIEKFFATLKDGDWHNIPEFAEQVEITPEKLAKYSQFLGKQGIVQYDDKNCRVKIEHEWQPLIPDETPKQKPPSHRS